MKEPSLKWTLLAVVIGVTVFLLSFNSYSYLVTNNYGTISSNYTAKYQNITKYQETYDNWGNSLTINDIFNIPRALIETFFTAVSLGASLLSNLLGTLGSVKEIINMLIFDPDFAGFSIMFGLLLTVFTIWIIYRGLSEARGNVPA